MLMKMEVIKNHMTVLFQSGLPIAIKMAFTLAFIKIIVLNGDVGSLADWGAVQNTVGIAVAIISLSTQSGIASAKVSKSDDHSLMRGVVLAATMVVLVVVFLGLVKFLPFEVALRIPIGILLIAGFFGSVYNYLHTYLPVIGRVDYLTFLNIGYGIGIIVLLYFNGVDSVFKLSLALAAGYFFSVGLISILIAQSERLTLNNYEWFNWPKYRYLISFGIASLFNTVVALMLLLFLRSMITEDGGGLSADYFEASVRLVSLIEAAIGSVIGIIVWRRVGQQGNASLKILLPFIAFSFLSVLGVMAVFYIFGDDLIRLIFSEDYLALKSLIPSIVMFSFLKIVISIVVIPIFLKQRIFLIVVSELLYFGIVIVIYRSLSSVYKCDLVWFSINSMSLGLLSCLVIFVLASREKKSNAEVF